MYATLAQLKTYLGVTSTADDALLTDLLTRATAAIEQMTRKTFAAPAATARTFGRELMLWDAQLQRDLSTAAIRRLHRAVGECDRRRQRGNPAFGNRHAPARRAVHRTGAAG
jgi:hypothetical protein